MAEISHACVTHRPSYVVRIIQDGKRDRAERQQLYDHYGLEGGQRTVPQIIHIDFIGSQERIGGYQELIEPRGRGPV